MKKLYLIFGFIFTYILYKNICNIDNKCPYKFNQLQFEKNKIHLHHWLIHLLLLPLVYYIKNKEFKYLYIGIQMGGIFHGIYTYKDWYKIFK